MNAWCPQAHLNVFKTVSGSINAHFAGRLARSKEQREFMEVSDPPFTAVCIVPYVLLHMNPMHMFKLAQLTSSPK